MATAPGASLPPPPPPQLSLPPPPPPIAPPRRSRWIVPVIIVCGILIAAGVLLATVPVSHPFSGTIVQYTCPPFAPCFPTAQGPSAHFFPAGSPVQLSWQAKDGIAVNFYVLTAQGHVAACSSSGTNGSCSFTAQLGLYGFNFQVVSPPVASGPSEYEVDYSGSYAAPLL